MIIRFKQIFALIISFAMLNLACRKDPEIVQHFPGWHSFGPHNSPLDDYGVRGIAMDLNGNVWVTNLNRLFKYDGEQWQWIEAPNGDYNAITFSYGAGSIQHVYLCGGDGLAKVNVNTHEVFVYDQSNSGIASQSLGGVFIDRIGSNDITWLATSHGLNRFDGSNWQTFDMSNSPMTAEECGGITLDHFGRAWFCVREHPIIPNDTSAFVMYDEVSQSWQVFTAQQTGFDIYGSKGNICDRNGSVWFCGAGAYRWDGQQWTHFDHTNSMMPEEPCTSISADSTGKIWFGSFDGIVTYNNGQWERITTANSGLMSDSVISIATRTNGQVWIGTINGISVYEE